MEIPDRSAANRVVNAVGCLLLLIALAMLAAGPVDANAETGKPRVVKAVTSADGAGAIATAKATCPKQSSPTLGPWRALSGGFVMTTFTTAGDPTTVPVVPYGSGVVYESRREGQRSWRVSAQSLSGRVDLAVYANCQRNVPKPRVLTSTISTPGVAQVGPATVAHCPTGRAVAGGFSTPPPFTAGEAANTVVGSFPTGTRAWKVQVVSNQPSSLTTYAYCAKRKQQRIASVHRSAMTTLANTLAYSTGGHCPPKRFAPGGGGFQQQGITPSQYLIPIRSTQRPSAPGSTKPPPPGYPGNVWEAHGLKVGSGTPVTMTATRALCG